MDYALDAWQLFDQALRSVFRAFWQLPALIVFTLVLYALISSYGLRVLPFAANDDWRQIFINDAFYDCLHAIIFTPLVIAIMQMILFGQVRKQDFWSKAALYVMGCILLREIVDLLLVVPVWAWEHAVALSIYDWIRDGVPKILLSAIYVAPTYIWYLVCFFIWVRLALLWPKFALDSADGKATIIQAWREMGGYYRFALWASFLTTLPYWFFESFIYSHVYTRLVNVGAPVSSEMTVEKIEGLLVRSGELVLRYMLYASLAAWLYRVIQFRRKEATVLSLSHTHPAHRQEP